MSSPNQIRSNVSIKFCKNCYPFPFSFISKLGFFVRVINLIAVNIVHYINLFLCSNELWYFYFCVLQSFSLFNFFFYLLMNCNKLEQYLSIDVFKQHENTLCILYSTQKWDNVVELVCLLVHRFPCICYLEYAITFGDYIGPKKITEISSLLGW